MPRPVRIAETPPRFPLKVQSVSSAGPGVVCLRLDPHPVPWQSGDCVTLYAPGGEAGRPYSFSGNPNAPFSEFWIRNVPGGTVSPFLVEAETGITVEASPPFGWFRPLEPADAPKLYVATGTGIAPFLSALRADPSLQNVSVLWGMREELELPEELKNVDLQRCISRVPVNGIPSGRVTDLLSDIEVIPEHHVYLCGLDAMVEEVSFLVESRGVAVSQIHKEVFFTESSSAS